LASHLGHGPHSWYAEFSTSWSEHEATEMTMLVMISILSMRLAFICSQRCGQPVFSALAR
jgi:hypothetical protein